MPLNFIDTHCHIQSAGLQAGERTTRDAWTKAGISSVDELVSQAVMDGVSQMICVGCDVDDSVLAVDCAKDRNNLFASIGIHPHEAVRYASDMAEQARFAQLASADKVIAIGECGLDYFYEHSPRDEQLKILEFQFELAQAHDLPMIFHVREAFEDFWPVFERFPNTRGVLHSFTDSTANMERAVAAGLYIGVNGIATFAKQPEQRAMYQAIPLENLVLETDAPFLTPVPFRGRVCEPKHLVLTAEFLASLRGDTAAEIADATTRNARILFNL